MASRDENESKLHYATILPSNIRHQNPQKDSPVVPKQTALERAKALYVDFEDAFQDDTTNHDYFGFQSSKNDSSEVDKKSSEQPADFYLQSVETISELKATNYSPSIRYQASREGSRPSTPSDITPPYVPRINTRTNSSLNNQSRHSNDCTTDSSEKVHSQNDFRNSSFIGNQNMNETPPPFTPDAIKIRMSSQKVADDSLTVSTQFKLILPQYFLVKYLGRTVCSQLWGAQAVRQPIDDMVQNARQLSSINEVPTLEACINTRGLTLAHRQTSNQNRPSRNSSSDRNQNGLIPLDYISYVMHDVKYSKVAACIILRQSKPTTKSDESSTKNEKLTECYGFLFQSKDHANRFALSLAEAFASRKQSRSKGNERREGPSPQRRIRNRNGLHHERMRVDQYDDSYLRDSEV